MRTFLKRAFPRAWTLLKARTGRLYDSEIEALVLERSQRRVLAGPFQGMRYVDRANCSVLVAKLIGSYERELVPFIEAIIASDVSHVVDIGSAEGYYAVGLALRMPRTRVHAYDIDASARQNLQRLIEINGVGHRVSVGSECTPTLLNEFKGGAFAVLCDIEGAETDLLQPSMTPALDDAIVLVEIHDGPNSSAIWDTLEARFAATHIPTRVRYQGRSPADAAVASWLGHDRNKALAVDEHRHSGLWWGFFEPRSRKLA